MKAKQRVPGTKNRSPSPSGALNGKFGRRRLRTVLLVVAAAVVLAVGWYLWGWYTAPAPPAMSFADVDPAVHEAIDTASREVWWRPRSPAAWGKLGQLLCAHGYRAESNVCFTHAERLDRNNPRWPYLQGVNLQLEDPENAIHYLQRAVALCDRVPDAPRLTLAETCLQQKQLGEAEAHFRRVLERAPDNARAHLGLGRLAYERGDLRDGLAHLNRSASDRHTQKASCILRAQVYHRLGDSAAAGRERARAAELPEDRPWPDPFVEETRALIVGKQARLARLQTLVGQGRLEEAGPLASQLKQDYPDVSWLVEGRQQTAKGNSTAAEQAFRKAIELAPDSIDAHFDLGTLLFKQGNYGAAAESFRRVTQLEPEYGPAYLALGRCCSKQGDQVGAIRAFRAALQYMPHDADTHRDLGDLLAQHGQVAEARVHLERALQLQPGDARTRQLLEDVSKRLP
jgi:tetratricopeptide (TPR) repeat protein